MPTTASCHFSRFCALFWLLGSAVSPVVAQRSLTPSRITQPVDDKSVVVLQGNVHPLARAELSLGAAPADLHMDRMLLVLKRSPEQEATLAKLLQDQQDKASSHYRKWLTPEQFGQQFGPADQDLEQVQAWLQAHGFQDILVSKG